MKASCESQVAVFDFDVPPKTWPGSPASRAPLFKCPLWVKSRRLQCKTTVRFTPESGHLFTLIAKRNSFARLPRDYLLILTALRLSRSGAPSSHSKAGSLNCRLR